MKSIVLFVTLLTIGLASTASAEQYPTASGQVVHTRRAPVVMHRVLPPFRGVHVYQGRAR
jgi:hypothetical protein